MWCCKWGPDLGGAIKHHIGKYILKINKIKSGHDLEILNICFNTIESVNIFKKVEVPRFIVFLFI